MTLSKFVEYIKQAWANRPSATTPISAERLLHMESGIKANNEAIRELAAAVVSAIVNDPNKIASMAALYAVNQAVTELNSNKVGTNPYEQFVKFANIGVEKQSYGYGLHIYDENMTWIAQIADTSLCERLNGFAVYTYGNNAEIDFNSDDLKRTGIHIFQGNFSNCTNFISETVSDSAMLCLGSKFAFRLINLNDALYFQRLAWDGSPGSWKSIPLS